MQMTITNREESKAYRGIKAMRTFLRGLIIPAAGLLLTACGGGSSSGTSEGGGAFIPPGSLGPDERIEIEVTRTELPANVAGVAPFVGSPFIAEIQVTALRADGRLVPNGTTVSFSVTPVEIGALSTLDDPSTTDVNEFLQLLGSGFEETNSGQIKVFFHAFDKPGTARIRFSFEDENTGNVIAQTLQIRVVESGSTLLPDNLMINRQDQPLYTQGSGGNTSIQVEVTVEDGGNEPVPDPQGFNNLEISLDNEGPSLGASLAGTNAAGNAVSGNRIRLKTTNGRATFSLRSGDKTGTQTVRITADRQDNNVDNGIGDALQSVFDAVISDGRLFSVRLTSPNVNAILINRVNPEIAIGSTDVVPPDPDGTYSLTVSAIANDRGGNPVLPGTEIQFGLIDAPITGFPESGSGTFSIAGTDGDPAESKVNFTAPTGAFATAGGGAGPGDTLVLFGEEAPPGNTDLEGARIIDAVLSNTNLRVTQRFNANDTTGSSVDNGPVIPYVIGRAGNGGNIGNFAVTDENGAATVTLNFPVSRVGQSAIIWAQGAAAAATKSAEKAEVETAADVARVVYPGVAPALFSAAPTQLPANTTIDVLLCLSDAAGTPLRGVFIGFTVENPQGATVTVDGTEGSGTVLPATGSDGCTIATVSSQGVAEPFDNIVITFFVGGLPAQVEIIPPGNTVLFAIPSQFRGDGFKEITLRYLDAGGNPIPDVQINFTCTASEGSSVSIIDPPGRTDANGETEATASVSVDNIEGGGSAQCTFFPAGGPPPEAVVDFIGFDLCDFSPQPAGCSEEEG